MPTERPRLTVSIVAGIPMSTIVLSTMPVMPCTATDVWAVTALNTNTPATSTTSTRKTSIAPLAIRAATLATGTSTATPSPVTTSSVA